ncbi:MAG: hypothetical protein KAJ93_08010 [Methanosarcinales archaeon]|nr:hypothetical protein [Methanosarcinales archaeon]
MTSAGFACVDQSYFGAVGGYTSILNQSIIDANGTLKSWCVYIAESDGSAKLKVFRDDGTNYVFVGESDLLSVTLGANNDLSCDIAVQSGDILGIYMTSSMRTKYTYTTSTPYAYIYKSGDVSTTSLKTSWSTSMTGHGQKHTCYAHDVVENFYVKASGGNDSNSGESWANAWATIDKAATTVADGKTVHIGFGNYSQTNAQDIAPVNAGSIGIKYLPETAVTGGGTGEVNITLTT